MLAPLDTWKIVTGHRVCKAGIPKRFWPGFETFEALTPAYAELKKTAQVWSDSFHPARTEKGLALIGKTGVGKSHLAGAIARRVIENGFTVCWYNMATLFLRIRSTWDRKDEFEEDLLAELVSADLLILDDVGVERPNAWILERLYVILNQRHELCKVIVFTSNYTGVELIERMEAPENQELGRRVISRLSAMAVSIGTFPEQDQRLKKMAPPKGVS